MCSFCSHSGIDFHWIFKLSHESSWRSNIILILTHHTTILQLKKSCGSLSMWCDSYEFRLYAAWVFILSAFLYEAKVVITLRFNFNNIDTMALFTFNAQVVGQINRSISIVKQHQHAAALKYIHPNKRDGSPNDFIFVFVALIWTRLNTIRSMLIWHCNQLRGKCCSMIQFLTCWWAGVCGPVFMILSHQSELDALCIIMKALY